MRKLGSASTDLTKGIATLALLLYLISGAARFDVFVRVTVGAMFFIGFVSWYFERYTFYENHIELLRLSKLRRPRTVVNASSVESIKFHKHLDLATGTMVYIHFGQGEQKDMIAFNFRRKHLFILEFAAINAIAVDTGKIDWIESARRGIVSKPPANADLTSSDL